MLDIIKKITDENVEFRKNGEKVLAAVTNVMLSKIKLAAKETELKEEDVSKIIIKEYKEAKETLYGAIKSGREELIKDATAQVKYLESKMPKQLSAEEIEKIVKEIIADLKISAKSEKGKLMKSLMPRIKGKADGKEVNKIVDKLLK